MPLNPEQQIVVRAKEGAYSLLSGPGTGKTTALVARYDALRKTVNKDDILGITFTKEAALEMGRRANGNFRTFHSFGYEIIAKEKGRPPMEPELRHRLLCTLVRKYRLDYKELTAFISSMRHQNITPEQAVDEFPYGKPQAYREYESERTKAGWIDFDCQPPNTMVSLASGGRIPICDLRVGDVVFSWNRKNQTLRKRRVSGKSRQRFDGNLIKISCGDKQTRTTPNHWFWVKFNKKAHRMYAVYLMWKEGLGFRVGQCKFFSNGFANWPQRLSHQKADKMWILSTTPDYYESLTMESEISAKYGIPQTVFRGLRGYPTISAIRRIFKAASPLNGTDCLKDFGLLFERPLLEKRNKMQQWTRKKGGFIKISACNLLAEIMSLPYDGEIVSVSREEYHGPVYSLSVDEDHTYFADGLVTGNSMIRDAVNLLEDPSVRKRYQYPFIMADECQDADDLQFRFLQLLSKKYGNIMCIGDPGQSIYLFRGAKPDNLVNFTSWFPEGKYLYLGLNYRSTVTITNYVQRHYPLEIELKKKIAAARADIGVPIEYRMYDLEDDEAEAAVAASNVDPLNSAILARTNRQLGTLENFCDDNNVPYTLLGKSGFWKQAEIRKAVDKLQIYPTLTVADAMSVVMPFLERHYQAEDATPADNYALENIRKFRDIIEKKRFGSCREAVAYATKRMHTKRKVKGITLSTVHQAKGCEWKNVFVVGVRDQIMPHAKGDWSEERRIFMVAISRAKDRLRLSFTGPASPFIRPELTPEIMQSLEQGNTRVERLQIQQSLF